MWKLPRETTITLAEQETSSNNDRNLKIVTLDQVPESIKKQLIKLN